MRLRYTLNHDLVFLCVDIRKTNAEIDDGDGRQVDIPPESSDEAKKKAVEYLDGIIIAIENFKKEILQ